MSDIELKSTIGGATTSYTSAAFLNAIARGIDACYSIGKAAGTAIRMLLTGKKCS